MSALACSDELQVKGMVADSQMCTAATQWGISASYAKHQALRTSSSQATRSLSLAAAGVVRSEEPLLMYFTPGHDTVHVQEFRREATEHVQQPHWKVEGPATQDTGLLWPQLHPVKSGICSACWYDVGIAPWSHLLCMQPSSIRNTGPYRTFPADPDNVAIKQKIAWTEDRDNKGLPTIPSSIGVSSCTSAYARTIICGYMAWPASHVLHFTLQEENLINPFLRPDDPVMKKFTQKSDPMEVLAALRSAKDSFKG